MVSIGRREGEMEEVRLAQQLVFPGRREAVRALGKSEGPTGACGAENRLVISTLLLHQPCQLITHPKGVRPTGAAAAAYCYALGGQPREIWRWFAISGAAVPRSTRGRDGRSLLETRTADVRLAELAAASSGPGGSQSGAGLTSHKASAGVSRRCGGCPLSQAGSRARRALAALWQLCKEDVGGSGVCANTVFVYAYAGRPLFPGSRMAHPRTPTS